MNVELITQKDLEKLKSDLISEFKQLMQEQAKDKFKDTWIRSNEVPGLLGISTKTWQTWRDKRVIPFAQFGAKIYVKLEDIHQLLESNRKQLTKKFNEENCTVRPMTQDEILESVRVNKAIHGVSIEEMQARLY